jgi:N-acetylglucosamine kinase-like BadF-type ATPase
MPTQLIADSGSTSTTWCLLIPGQKKKTIQTRGISPYFQTGEEIQQLLLSELLPKLKGTMVDEIHYYGTGCGNVTNVKMIKDALKKVFGSKKINVNTDLLAAARAVCGNEKGVVCILGTGSNSCYYNGNKIVKNSPGLGFILGDEGSGAHLGKKVMQYYLYGTFDEDLMDRFAAKYQTNSIEMLEAVYREPLPNRYMANFAGFLVENRGHYMIENIIEDSMNDFIFHHIYKFKESWTLPVHFVGSVANGFKDVIKELFLGYELQMGKVVKSPMDGLIAFHTHA